MVTAARTISYGDWLERGGEAVSKEYMSASGFHWPIIKLCRRSVSILLDRHDD
jgi:hypothetical protein